MSVDFTNNANQRTPCVLVLDASTSMMTKFGNTTGIEALNQGLIEFEQALKNDDMAISRVSREYRSVGIYTWYIIPTINRSRVGLISAGGWDGTVNSFSMKEVEPYAISSHIKGTMNYIDTGTTAEVVFWRRYSAYNYFYDLHLRTNTGRQGQVGVAQRNSGNATTAVTADSVYTPGLNLPYNIAGRHSAAFVRGTNNGTLTGIVNNVSSPHLPLPDLTSINLSIAPVYMGTIDTFTMWDDEIGEAGSISITT
jgi:hypothetical protein